MVVSGTFFVREKNRITRYTTVAFFNVKCFNGICSIEVYEDVEEFLEKSGWRRDNPELCSECYLFENHICRKIQGKIWYFSRIQYENGLRGMKQGFN